jgi:hypothetical protein
MSTKATAAIDQEIAREKAEALGRAAKLLEDALRALRDHEALAAVQSSSAGTRRERLVAEAAYRAQNVVIQRESLGLRDPREVFEFYSVPREVVVRIGARES